MSAISGIVGPVPVPILRYLTDDGLAESEVTNNFQAIGDFTNKKYYFESPSSPYAIITRINRFKVRIETSVDIVSGFYGSDIDLSYATNPTYGISIGIESNTGTLLNDLTRSVKIRRNFDWDRFGEVRLKSIGSATKLITIEGVVDYNGKSYIRLQSTQRLVFNLTGDFSSLTYHTFSVAGYFENKKA